MIFFQSVCDFTLDKATFQICVNQCLKQGGFKTQHAVQLILLCQLKTLQEKRHVCLDIYIYKNSKFCISINRYQNLKSSNSRLYFFKNLKKKINLLTILKHCEEDLNCSQHLFTHFLCVQSINLLDHSLDKIGRGQFCVKSSLLE